MSGSIFIFLLILMHAPLLFVSRPPELAEKKEFDSCSLEAARSLIGNRINEILPMENLTYRQMANKYGETRLQHIFFCVK